jgi:hypothetical protein
MRRHRTTARGVLFLAATIGLAVGSAVAFAAATVPEHIIFPVVGKAAYIDDFGAPRLGGRIRGTTSWLRRNPLQSPPRQAR